MAMSVVGGDLTEAPPPPPGPPFSHPEDNVLCELNAEFRRSKSELIQRFLRDQEDLNQRFAEYALNSDDSGDPTDETVSPVVSPRVADDACAKDSEIYDVLQDIEDKDLPDNLSIASAVNSSSDAPSLSDCTDRTSDEEFEEEERDYDENWNVTQQAPGSYDEHFYDQYSREAATGSVYQRSTSTESYGFPHMAPIPHQNHQQQQQQQQQQPVKTKKIKDPVHGKKIKKLLVKKNIRPQTAMGVRAIPDSEDILCANTSDCKSLKQKPLGPAAAPSFALHDSMNMVGARFKKISWTGGTEDHPELGRLSISASVHKLPQRSHTPGGRLKSSSSPLVSASSLTRESERELCPSAQSSSSSSASSHRGQQSPHRRLAEVRRSKTPAELKNITADFYRAGTPLGRPESSQSNRSLISLDINPEHLAGYGRRQPNPGGQPFMRGVYSSERTPGGGPGGQGGGGGGGRIVMSPSLADVKGKKRPIAVLKLPPLDSSVVNRAMGAATVDPTGHPATLVSPPKSNTVATPSAI